MSSTAHFFIDRVLEDKNNEEIRKKMTVENLSFENTFNIQSSPEDIEERDRYEESPMPSNADLSEIDQMMSFLSDRDSNGDANNVSHESEEDNSNRSDEKNTLNPSPESTKNHLDSSNSFYLWYIENVIKNPYSAISSTDLLSTLQANTQVPSFSEAMPGYSGNTIPRRDVGNTRPRNDSRWTDSKRKELKNSGKEYKSRNGTTRPAISLKPMCQKTCRQKCYTKISSFERISIFNQFWNLGNKEQQWVFVANLVLKKLLGTANTATRRNFTLIYRLKANRGDGDEFIVVCKKTFLNTLSISEQFVHSALEKVDVTSGFIKMDHRGRHGKAINEDVIRSVCDHIKSIQSVKSHDTRSRSDTIYLDGGLNFRRLFDLYKEWFDEQLYSSNANTETKYRNIVNEHFKLSFYTPKKDQCDKCHIYKNNSTPTLVETLLYESHLRNIDLAYKRKCLDIDAAKNSYGQILTATFDFQKVLNAPHGNLSILNYKRKLSIFNLTVFNLADKEVTCFMWDEGEGKKDANEVSSCMIKFISKHKNLGTDEFRFWSGNCVGHNSNRIVYAMYMYAAATCQVSIRHCFFEVGHTQHEGNNVHDIIEAFARNKLIFTPQEWHCLVRWARPEGKKPFEVEEMQYTNFSNFESLLQGNWIKSDNGDEVQWNKIKEVFVKSDDPHKLYYKYDMASNDYYVLSVKENCSTDSSVSVEPLYHSNLAISKDKKDDLISMCNFEIIPRGYHDFFTNLPSENVIDNDNDFVVDLT